MTSTTPTASTRLRRLMSGAVFAASVTLGGNALADPATASAREWDTASYDRCMDGVLLNFEIDSPDYHIMHKYCCEVYGGVWNATTKECGAPPADEAERPLPPRVAPGAETTAPLVPGPVTSPTTHTFAPGPAKQGS